MIPSNVLRDITPSIPNLYNHEMTEYKVLSGGSPAELAKKVNEALAEKWKLKVSVAKAWDSVAKNKLYQAMAR